MEVCVKTVRRACPPVVAPFPVPRGINSNGYISHPLHAATANAPHFASVTETEGASRVERCRRTAGGCLAVLVAVAGVDRASPLCLLESHTHAPQSTLANGRILQKWTRLVPENLLATSAVPNFPI